MGTFLAISPYLTPSVLVASRQLSIKDLGYAIDNAWDERVREAAIALMLVRLQQAVQEPLPSAGPLKVVSGGRSFAERRQLFLATAEGALLGAVFAVAIGFLVWALTNAVSSASAPANVRFFRTLSSPVGIVAGVLALLLGLGIAKLVSHLSDRAIDGLDHEIELYRRGELGEDETVDVIRQVLDGSCCLFRNLVLPGRNKADLDLVLVGPFGVWVLEVKSFAGEYRNFQDNWEYRAGSKWKPSNSSPGRQARTNAARLSAFLKADGIDRWVEAAVVWVNRETPLVVENPATPVWPLERLPDELGNIHPTKAFPDAERQRVIEKLTSLCQDQARRFGV